MTITVAMLRAIQGLKAYSDQDLSALIGAAVEKTLEPGATMCKEGEPGRSCFVIVSGEAQAFRASAAGERALMTLGPGAIVGQIALVDRGPRSASVRARTSCLTLELTREVFEQLLASQTPLALKFHENIAINGIRQLRSATEQLMKVIEEREKRLQGAPVILATPGPSGRPPSRPGQVTLPRASQTPPLEPSERERNTLSYIRAAATHWELSLDELDDVKVVPQTMRSNPPKP